MLLERESSLGSLGQYATEARRGEGRLVLVSGEAGVGKSALVEQLEEDTSDARWLWGACDGLFTPRPLGPLFDIAEHLGGELLDLCRAHAPRDDLFAALLRQANDPATLSVLVFEDVHWADEATVDLLRFLGRRLRNTAVLLIATYRDDAWSASDPLRLALGELATQRSTRRIGLGPLSAGAIATLATGSGLDAAELHRLTNGNPFYATEALRGGADVVPPSARDAVLARGARLRGTARELLDVAALTGTRVEVRLLEAVTVCPPDAIDELLTSGLLTGDGEWLRFRHEIARLAVEQAVAAHRRVAIHARVLAALGVLGCDEDARMAFHAEAAGDGPAVFAHAARAAQRSAELGSHREAAAQFERALRHTAGADDAMLASLYEGYASEVSVLDRWTEAADADTQALALWRASGNRLREGDTLRRLSRTMWRLCRSDEAFTAAEAAVDVLEPLGDGAELASAYANLAGHHMQARHADIAIELARRAQELAGPMNLPAVRSDAANTMAMAMADAGREWAAGLQEALDIATAHRLPSQVGRAYSNLYATYAEHRRFEEAERYFVEGFAYTDERDMGVYTTCLLGERSSVMEKTGRWDEALALGTDLLRRVASPVNRINPLMSVGTVRARRGDSGVWECLDEAAAAADGSREPEWIAAVRIARTEAFWLEGHVEAALQEVGLVADLAARCDPWERGTAAVWLRRLGSDRRIEGAVAEPYRLMIDGDGVLAARRWTDLGCVYDAALALFDVADEAALREALSLFDSLGAAPAARLTRHRMRQVGIRSIPSGAQSATRSHPAGLTRREHEVLDLICAGHTNAEIATLLFISAKTVDHHVSAVLAKLGTPTRTAAASEAARLGLVGAAK